MVKGEKTSLPESMPPPMFKDKQLKKQSAKCNQSSGTLSLKFKVVPVESAMGCVEEVYLREFRGDEGEVAFLKLLFKSAYELETMAITMANPSFTPYSPDVALSKVKSASDARACRCRVVVLVSTGPEGGKAWSFKKGIDFSLEDPFSEAEIDKKA